MPRIFLPPGCAGIADGNWKRFADKPGGHINLDDTDPVERRQLAKLAAQDYASAGLVDAGPEKFFTTRRDDGRWTPTPIPGSILARATAPTTRYPGCATAAPTGTTRTATAARPSSRGGSQSAPDGSPGARRKPSSRSPS